MCGFVGAISVDASQVVEQNLHLLHRRGPDSKGILSLENGMVLAATRLAMTDPHIRSNQPMVDSISGNVLLFNGEVYNYELLRKSLIVRNIKFYTNSDTEVILKGLTFFGNEYVSNLEGMFAFAFYNRKANSVTLARDFLGKKPLYFALLRDRFIFSSQINFVKKFLKRTTLSKVAISNYMALGYLIDPLTMFQEIISVEPGEIIEVDLNQMQIKSKLKFKPCAIGNSSNLDIKTSLNHAIVERIKGHDQFALSLSGGVDSTILLLQCLNLGFRPEPFTIKWPDADKPKYNLDAEIALRVTKKLGINLNVIEMPEKRSLPGIVLEYSKAMEEPNSNPSGISMMALYSKISQKGLRLVLTGDGADEIFGGYQRYRLVKRMEFFPKINNRILKWLLINNYSNTRTLSKITTAFLKNEENESWLYWHLIAGNNEIKKIFANFPEFSANIFDGDLSDFFNYSKSHTAKLMFKDLKTWIPMESNRKLDRISMWHSIEARSPYQSEQVINAGYKSMDSYKFKYINKELLQFTFPQFEKLIPNTKKMGFISPLGSWLRSNPELIMNSLEVLKINLSLNKYELDSLAKAPSEGDFHKIKILWSLIILGQWFNVNL